MLKQGNVYSAEEIYVESEETIHYEFNITCEYAGSYVINGSLNGNAGIVGVNQSVGNLANQGNVFSLAGVQPVNGG